MIALGVDIGGTSIKMAAVDDAGKLYAPSSFLVDKSKGQFGIAEQLINKIKEYLKTPLPEPISGIGLGIPGSIDSVKGVVSYSNNLGWAELPIVELIQKEINLPVKIANDANAAAFGEAVFGAGKDYANLIMLTLGTGVGGGIVINHQLYEGVDGKGAELGHATLILGGEPCTCGRFGCLEAYASATALKRQTTRAMDTHKDSLMWKLARRDKRIGGRICFEAEKLGDKAAHELVEQYISYLGEGILNYCNIFRPDIIVLSGGVAKMGPSLASRLQTYVADRNYGFGGSPKTLIRIASLGYESGIIGAACLILKKK